MKSKEMLSYARILCVGLCAMLVATAFADDSASHADEALSIEVATGQTVTYSGVLSGTTSITKTGAGTLILSNSSNTLRAASPFPVVSSRQPPPARWVRTPMQSPLQAQHRRRTSWNLPPPAQHFPTPSPSLPPGIRPSPPSAFRRTRRLMAPSPAQRQDANTVLSRGCR